MNSSMETPGVGANASLGVQVVNQSTYSPEATAAIAITITLMMLFTIFGNILVIIAVLTSRSLRGPQNLFLVSLAAADILVATLIIPFSLANELMGYWYFRNVWCEIYLALDVFFCTSSIVHLCAISLDRYLSLSRPVSYTSWRTPGRIKAAIVVVWLIAAVISFPPLLSMNKSLKEKEGRPECKLNDDRWYILYSTIGSFFAPCLIMILVYVRIYQIAKQHTRCPPGEPRRDVSVTSPQKGGGRVQRNGADPGGSAKKQGGSGPPALNAPPSSSSSPSPSPAQGEAPVTSQKAQPHMPASAPALTFTTGSSAPLSVTSEFQSDIAYKPQGHQQRAGSPEKQPETSNDDSSSPESDNETPERQGTNGTTVASGPKTLAQKCRNLVITSKGTQLAKPKPEGTPNTARRKALANREKRFTFVLAVVIGVFVICWFPFFFSYSLEAICPDTCRLPKPLFNFFFWIGYCNSSLNPLIYTIFNKDFRKAFKKILCKDTKNTFF